MLSDLSNNIEIFRFYNVFKFYQFLIMKNSFVTFLFVSYFKFIISKKYNN